MDPVAAQLLSIAQAAQRLSVTPAAIKKWLTQRRLPVVKLGRLTRLRACDLEDVVQRGLPPSGTHPRKPRDH
jgi:excisionase family DNA binding protein